MSDLMNIGALARAVGIPADTLRTWERRYGVPAPQRTPTGHRRYDNSTVDHLVSVRKALDLGHRASVVLGWSPEQLQENLHRADNRARGQLRPTSSVETRVIATAVGHARQFEDDKLDQLLAVQWAREPSLAFITRIAIPFIHAVGEAWESGDIGVCHEHYASERLRYMLETRWRELSSSADGPLVLCATPEGEHHVLGLHIAALVASIEGARIVFLGADVPTAEFGRITRQLPIAGIMLSISNCVESTSARRNLETIVSLVGRVPILVGGSGAPEGVDKVHVNGDFESAAQWVADLSRPKA